MTNKLLAIFFSLLILGQAYLVRRYAGTWFVPACMFGLFWFFMSFGPLVVLFFVPIDPYGTGFILLCLCFFSASAVFYPWRSLRVRPTNIYDTPFLRKAFYLLSVSAFTSIVLNSLAQDITLSDLLTSTITAAASYRDLVTGGDAKVTIWVRLGEVFSYATAALGGLVISTLPTKWARLRVMLFTFIPTAFMAVAQSSKWTLFCCIAFFYAGVLAYRVSQGNFQLVKKESFKKLMAYAAILFAIATASFMSRGLQNVDLQNSDNTDLVRNRLKLVFASYSSGHLYGFSDWCAYEMGRKSQTPYTQEGTTYGFYTFSPIFRTLGSTKITPEGIYDDYYSYEDVLLGNIYTMFRGLIQDFGVFGSLVFMFFLGLAFHGAFYALLLRRLPSLSATVFIFSVGFMYASYGRSLFTWSALYFTFILLYSLLYVNRNGWSLFPEMRSRQENAVRP